MPVCRPWLIPVAIVLISQFAEIQSARAQAVGEYLADGLTLILGSEKARITYMGERCIGDFSGDVIRQHDRIMLVDLTAELSPECVFTLTGGQHGTIIIEQGEGCTTYHGAECSLSGQVHLKKHNQSQKVR